VGSRCALGVFASKWRLPQPARACIRVGQFRPMTEWQSKLLYDGPVPVLLPRSAFAATADREGHLEFEDVASPDFDLSRYGRTREELLGVFSASCPMGAPCPG
jgi:hypothetical protein